MRKYYIQGGFTMKSFFIDYWELCKQTGVWMKKHWKGYLVYVFIVAIVSFFPYIIEFIKEKRLEKKNSQMEEEHECQL